MSLTMPDGDWFGACSGSVRLSLGSGPAQRQSV